MSTNTREKKLSKTKLRTEVPSRIPGTIPSTSVKRNPTKTLVSSISKTTAAKDEEARKVDAARKTDPTRRLKPSRLSTEKNFTNPPSVTKNPIVVPSVTKNIKSHLPVAKGVPKVVQPSITKQYSKPNPRAIAPIRKPPTDKVPPSKPNFVKSTILNVTVSSPPPKRREKLPESKPDSDVKTLRRKTFTLEDHKLPKHPAVTESLPPAKPVPAREPVAFEVTFDGIKRNVNTREQPVKKARTPTTFRCTTPTFNPKSNAVPNYDDDFEAYESDFETGSSSVDGTPTNSQHNADSASVTSKSDLESDSTSAEEEESDLTQFPVTVIHRNKEQENKLDSGNYDLHSKKQRIAEVFDSLDTIANSEQLDSGISYENCISLPTTNLGLIVSTFAGNSGFQNIPRTTNRGNEIMKKIQLDTLEFNLFNLKPVPYDEYMNMFGSLNTVQSATQTMDDNMDSDCQTEEIYLRTVWTQHPPQYDLVSIEKSSGQPGYSGEEIEHNETKTDEGADPLDNTVKVLSKLQQNSTKANYSEHLKPVDFERLNAFLNRASRVISEIIHSNSSDQNLQNVNLPEFSSGFYTLNTSFLNALKVVRIFANAKFNLVLTVHKSVENVYQTDFMNLIMVWDVNNPNKPTRLLSTWSEICHAEICDAYPNVVVCGLSDGSVATWDLTETYSFCSKLDGHLTHFAATHSITPSWRGSDGKVIDLGAVVDVKSFRTPSSVIAKTDTFKSVQFASLNESGILVVWTLLQMGSINFDTLQTAEAKLEYSSPWAQIKLTQSAICDLREYSECGSLMPQSFFERTMSNFQKNIFNDKVLKEISDTQKELKTCYKGLRFINIDCGIENIFIGTNRNFIISCTKALKKERFSKINIVERGFLFPTSIKLLENEDYLAVGLSDGSVLLLNRGRRSENNKDEEIQQCTNVSDTDEFDSEVGKSCAIQNIIRSERLSSTETFPEQNFRPTTAAFVEATIDGSKKPYELAMFDERILLQGCVTRKDLIQKLELPCDGWTMFALSDGDVRAYDFSTENEISSNKTSSTDRKIAAIAVCRGGVEDKKLILLQPNESGNDVEVHSLK